MTWASGNTIGYRFEKEFDDYWFLTKPEEFFHSHLPVEQKWTLLDDQFNREKFYSLPATISHHLFTLGVSVINPKNGPIEVGVNNKFVFEYEAENPETVISLYGFPWETYATLNNLPEPTDEEFKKIQVIII